MKAMYRESGYLIYPLGLYQPKSRQWQAMVIITSEELVAVGNPTLQHTKALPCAGKLFLTEMDAKEHALRYGRMLISSDHATFPKGVAPRSRETPTQFP